MSEDIITFDPRYFLDHQSKVLVPDNIKDKYKIFFDSYDCFSKLTGTLSPFKNVKHTPKSYDYDKRRKESRENKPLCRSVLGLLNVLNTSNYSRILAKVKLLTTESNVQSICKDIIKKGSIESMYANLFVKMIFDMHDSLGYHEAILGCLTDYLDEHYTGQKYICTNFGDTQSYDVFCGEMKHKNESISAHNFILEIYKVSKVPLKPCDEYLLNLCNLIPTVCPNEYLLDILLHLLILAKKQHFVVDINEGPLQTLVKDKINFSNKLRFLIEQLENL
jgi:hypothetical protein